jgi:hypothetical protein
VKTPFLPLFSFIRLAQWKYNWKIASTGVGTRDTPLAPAAVTLYFTLMFASEFAAVLGISADTL